MTFGLGMNAACITENESIPIAFDFLYWHRMVLFLYSHMQRIRKTFNDLA